MRINKPNLVLLIGIAVMMLTAYSARATVPPVPKFDTQREKDVRWLPPLFFQVGAVETEIIQRDEGGTYLKWTMRVKTLRVNQCVVRATLVDDVGQEITTDTALAEIDPNEKGYTIITSLMELDVDLHAGRQTSGLHTSLNCN